MKKEFTLVKENMHMRYFGMLDSNNMENPIVPRCKLVKDEDGARVDATQYKQMIGVCSVPSK